MEEISKGFEYKLGLIANLLEKGGRPAVLGEERVFGGNVMRKEKTGWVYVRRDGAKGASPAPVKKTSSEPQVSEEEVETYEANIPRPTVDARWQSYSVFLNMTASKLSKGLVAFGTGGVGKTFEMMKSMEAHGLKEYDESQHSLNDPEGYDYVKITGKASASAVYQALFEFQDKLVVFDDCDSALKDQDAVNFFKGAIDSSGDGTISYKASSPIKTDRIKGAIENNAGTMLVPNRFKFKGGVIFISNLSADKMPQPLIDSRCLAINLSMTKQETLDRITSILPLIKISGADGNLDISMATKQAALEFLKQNADTIREGKLNVRTLSNIVKIIHQTGGNEKQWKDIATTLLYS